MRRVRTLHKLLKQLVQTWKRPRESTRGDNGDIATQTKKPTQKEVGFFNFGGGWLTMCRLTSRAYEHWRGLLRVRAQLSEISGQLTSIVHR